MSLQTIINQVAKQNHTTPEHVYKEMKLAFELAKSCTDPAVQARWEAIPHKGNEISMEDLICHISALVKLSS